MKQNNIIPYSNVYPRPQFRRDSYICLNGEWDLNGKKVTVPFPPESEASGFSGELTEELRYTKKFIFSKTKEKTVLHFGAVDQTCRVFLNSTEVGVHEGGYMPFSFDVTGMINDGDNILEVIAVDRLSHDYPYGKQKKNRGGMWYTPISGIWQTVWLEELPASYITSVRIDTDMSGALVTYTVSDSEEPFTERFDIASPEKWTPDNPKLYYRTLEYKEDRAEIYFAIRKIEVKDKCVYLNGEPVFLNGVLDQGYYKDGIFLPGDPHEFENDVKRMKSLGFNMLRKHIKVEPEEYYYACDRLGMLVMQDIPNSGDYSFLRDTLIGTLGIKLSDRSGSNGKRKQFFMSHMKDIATRLHNHPSVIGYTVFNEGWGQFESDAMYSLLKQLEPDRLIDSTSGWFWQEKSDFDSYHVYFRNKKLKAGTRAMLLSECGGFSLKLDGHISTSQSYGYGVCESKEELTERIADMYEKMVIPAIECGLVGAVYTQLSDIEDEINGLYTYDREECKVNREKLIEISEIIKKIINNSAKR